MTFISYAQNREDVMLLRALKHVDAGFYVDVGANDPIEHSVTKVFYDRQWRGINIEPVSDWYERLLSERPRDINLKVAAGAYDGELQLFEVVDTGLSTTNEDYAKKHAEEGGFSVCELTVPVQTLSSIVQQHAVAEIHFLKIDVEGSERSVLSGLDLTIVRPWIILVEATQPNVQVLNFGLWENLITDHGYQFVYFDGLNRFYVANERSQLADSFSVPPNYWDHYKLHSEILLEEALTEKNKTLERVDASLRDLLDSRSMKITAPLRRGLKIARKVKRLPGSLPRKIVKTVVEQPQLRRIAKPIANKFPAIQYRLGYFLHQRSAPLTKLSPATDRALSVRSARVLQDLKQAIEQKK